MRVLGDALAEQGALKLWSVIVTVLGDMAEGGHEEVPGPVLSAMVEAMGLQPQAMRVALHRLTRDGWTENRKAARIGYYRLSPKGRAETRAVADRVYGRDGAEISVRLAVLPPDAEIPRGALALARQLFFIREDHRPPDGALTADLTGDLPDWVAERLAGAACEDGFRNLTALLQRIDPASAQTGLERLTLRILTLHGWRRLILRSDQIAETVLGAGAAVHECRKLVMARLEALPLPAPTDVMAEA